MGNKITPAEWEAAGKQAARELREEGNPRAAEIAEQLGTETARTVQDGGGRG